MTRQQQHLSTTWKPSMVHHPSACLFPSFQCLMILMSLFLLRLMWPRVLILHVLSLFTSSSHMTHLSAQLLHEHLQKASTLIYRVEYCIRYVSCCMRHDYTKLIWHAQTPKPVPLLNFSHDFTHLQQMCTISWMLKYKILLCPVFHLNWIFFPGISFVHYCALTRISYA